MSTRGLILVLALLLTACGSRPPAPITTVTPGPAGEYRVVRGDTLTKIARQHGQSVESLMRMNGISNPNHIRVGQVLKVQGGAAPGTLSSPAASVQAPGAGPVPAGAPRKITLVRPAQGTIRRGTSDGRAQGVYISAPAGTPVHAAAAGQVIFADQGPRGYGQLVLIRHEGRFITAYAHNERLLVKKGAQVRQGQQVATMGNSESRDVQLYFELRFDGKPVDALLYLPK